MVRIVNWLLTRKCNLNCDFCGIVKDYVDRPKGYPKVSQYEEMDTHFIIESLRSLKLHNKDCFHIFYGGEPTLRKDLDLILRYCNENDIHYTVISNMTKSSQKRLERLFNRVEVKGISCSVDPLVFTDDPIVKVGDRYKKSRESFNYLKYIVKNKIVKDVVAEITVDNNNLQDLPKLVDKLTEMGVCSSVTFIDISKSKYYDFSNITDQRLLVYDTPEVRNVLQKVSTKNVHMANSLLEKLPEILPSCFDCEFEKEVHNLTVDADGSVRLCLRIRGIDTPKHNLLYYLNPYGDFKKELHHNITLDKKRMCKACNWTCTLMTKLESEMVASPSDIIHTEKRI